MACHGQLRDNALNLQHLLMQSDLWLSVQATNHNTTAKQLPITVLTYNSVPSLFSMPASSLWVLMNPLHTVTSSVFSVHVWSMCHLATLVCPLTPSVLSVYMSFRASSVACDSKCAPCAPPCLQMCSHAPLWNLCFNAPVSSCKQLNFSQALNAKEAIISRWSDIYMPFWLIWINYGWLSYNCQTFGSNTAVS